MPPFHAPVRLTHAIICHLETSSSASACGQSSVRNRSYSCVRFSSSFSSILTSSPGSRAGDFFFAATRGGDTDNSRISGLRLLVLRSADRVARAPSIAGDDEYAACYHSSLLTQAQLRGNRRERAGGGDFTTSAYLYSNIISHNPLFLHQQDLWS